jgi:hypothetical protein
LEYHHKCAKEGRFHSLEWAYRNQNDCDKMSVFPMVMLLCITTRCQFSQPCRSLANFKRNSFL